MASPELKMVVSFVRERLDVDRSDFVASRAQMEVGTDAIPLPDGAVVEPVDAGGVPAEWVSMPGADPTRVVQYHHGGAYTAGSLATHRRFVAVLAEATGARVLNVDYRLAPEHPHPAAVDDAVAAYRWLIGDQGIDPAHVVICGDSAGGGLTAALLLALRDAGDPLPAGGALISPWVDLTMEGASHDSRRDVDPMCSRESLQPSVEAYAGGRDVREPLISPAHADLTGLPPILIHVGDHETLLDDSTLLAAVANKAGVDVELWVAPEMVHVWHVFYGLVPESEVAVDKLAAWIRTRLR